MRQLTPCRQPGRGAHRSSDSQGRCAALHVQIPVRQLQGPGPSTLVLTSVSQAVPASLCPMERLSTHRGLTRRMERTPVVSGTVDIPQAVEGSAAAGALVHGGSPPAAALRAEISPLISEVRNTVNSLQSLSGTGQCSRSSFRPVRCTRRRGACAVLPNSGAPCCARAHTRVCVPCCLAMSKTSRRCSVRWLAPACHLDRWQHAALSGSPHGHPGPDGEVGAVLQQKHSQSTRPNPAHQQARARPRHAEQVKEVVAVTPGSFEPTAHFYPRVLNAHIHPVVRTFLSLGNARIAKRYCHLHPEAQPAGVAAALRKARPRVPCRARCARRGGSCLGDSAGPACRRSNRSRAADWRRLPALRQRGGGAADRRGCAASWWGSSARAPPCVAPDSVAPLRAC